MYLNGTILNIAAHDAELAERLLVENERRTGTESQPAKRIARRKQNFWSKLTERPAWAAAPEVSADCGD